MNLPEGLIALLRQPSPCFLATVMPDGSPQLTQTWVDTDGEHVVINTVQGHQKVKNIERDPRVAVNVCDVSRPSRYYAIRGRVVNITAEGGAEHIEALARRYLGAPYPWYGGREPGPGHPDHQGGQDPRDGVARHHGSAQEPPRRPGERDANIGFSRPGSGAARLVCPRHPAELKGEGLPILQTRTARCPAPV